MKTFGFQTFPTKEPTRQAAGKSLRYYTYKDPNEGPVCYQLSSNKPEELAQATRIVTDCGADFIDLNCGCPVAKIRAKNAGSKHLSDPAKLKRLITAMKDNTDVPISVKIRVDGDSDESFNREVAITAEEAGADFLVVHGRHWKERYDTPCRFDEIKTFVDTVSIPVIGNGDVECINSLKQMLATGCAGVMISRASVGQPWLFAQLKAEMNNEIFVPPSTAEVGSMFIEHVNGLIPLIENEKFAIFQARKLSKYYARNIDHRTLFCDALNQCDNMAEFSRLVEKFFFK